MPSKDLNSFFEQFQLSSSILKEFSEEAFIELRGNKIPTRFLLNFLLEKLPEESIVEVKTEKQALNFTYGKNLSRESVFLAQRRRLEEGRMYLIIFDKKPLGYASFTKESKKSITLHNEMNIGMYLRE